MYRGASFDRRLGMTEGKNLKLSYRTNFKIKQFSSNRISSLLLSKPPVRFSRTKHRRIHRQLTVPIMSISIYLILIITLTQSLLTDCLPTDAEPYKQPSRLPFHRHGQEASALPGASSKPSASLGPPGGHQHGTPGPSYTLAFEEAIPASASKENRGLLVRKLLLDYPTDRNLELLRRLTNRRLDYQILYPANGDEEATAPGAPSTPPARRHRDAPAASQLREDNDDDEPPHSSAFDSLVGPEQLPAAEQLKYTTTTTSQPEAAEDPTSSRFQLSAHSLGAGNRPSKANQILGHYNRTNVVIKAFNYKFRLDLELNENLFGPSLMQKHFLPRGNQQISTQKIEHCYYHARTQPEARPSVIGAFRTCNGLSGIIHANNESFIIHPFYEADLNKKHPHIIYRYQTSIEPKSAQPDAQGSSTNQLPATNETTDEQQQQQQQTIRRECGNTRLHEWALRQFNKVNSPLKRTVGGGGGDENEPEVRGASGGRQVKGDCLSDGSFTKCDNNNYTNKARFSKRDVSLTEKYIELALILSQDVFDKRNSSTRLEVLQDAIQIINCLDLYFRSANTRVALIYIETWAHGDQIDISTDVKQTLYNFLEYSSRKLYKVSMDAVHLITGGHMKQFDSNEVGMSIPDSICTSRAVSVSQEASIFEPFIAASTIAHMLGHNLGMEHDGSIHQTQSSNSNHLQQQQQQQPKAASLDADSSRLQIGSMRSSRINLMHQPAVTAATINPKALNPHQSHSQHHHQNQQNQDQEDHEDEIKSRSLSYDEVQQELAESGDPVGHSSGSQQDQQQQQQHCRINCLMNERFTYLLPPVTFGNMVQQQVATTGPTTTNQTLIGAMGNFQDLTSSQASSSDQRQQQQQQQHYLNGITMNQIDNELNNDQQHPFAATSSLPFGFSRQSLDLYHRLLRYGHGICLFNKPDQLEDFKTCGNGIVDKGEDCDCGSIQECFESDSCCDPITCRFKADAECINGACCDRCRLRARGFVCRKLRGECDLAETCDGKAAHCGPDVHKQNGFPCSLNQGYCYLGQCPVPDQQCSELWGSDARKSDRPCYTNFNLNGTIRGNCGYDANLRKYKRCEHEHMMCGTLQCQLGDMKPVTTSIDSASGSASSNLGSKMTQATAAAAAAATTAAHEFSKKTLHALDGTHHECKVITASAGTGGHGQTSQLSSISYIRDGSKCQGGKVCFNFTCQPLEVVYRETYELCPRDERARYCSGNGICSTANRCHCEPGWLGHDCSQRDLAHLQSAGLLQLQLQLQQQQQQQPNTTAPPQASSMLPDLGGGQMLPPRSGAETSGELIGGGSQEQLQVQNSGATSANRPPLDRNLVIMGAPGLSPGSLTPAIVAPTEATTSSEPVISSQPAVTTTTTTPPPPPATPSTVHQDKKKHDALGAPTLVFILVSIVAAVYVGFALMANCYRRKGFLKPDKVLRHHQMNCKLDAIRSSFIAKRLADAAGEAGGILDDGDPSCLGGPPNTSGHHDMDPNLMNPFSFGPQSSMGPPPQPPPPTMPMLCQHIAGSAYGLAAESQNAEMPPSSSNNKPQLLACGDFVNHPVYTAAGQSQPGRPPIGGQQFSASVHYFDEQAQQQLESRNCIHNKQSVGPPETFGGFEPDGGDHNPLLMGTDNVAMNRGAQHQHQLPHRQNRSIPGGHAHQAPILRSFNASGAQKPLSAYKNTALSYHQTNQWLADNSSQSHTLTRIAHHQAPQAHESLQQRWHQHQQQHQHHQQQHHHHHGLGHHSHLPAAPCSINRATSLGNVNGGGGHATATRHLLSRLQRSNNDNNNNGTFGNGDDIDDDEARRVMTMHRALATPSRGFAASRTSGLLAGPTYYRRSPVEDSCSAPSSPEHRAPYWSDADRRQQQQQQEQQQRQRRSYLSRQSSSVSRQNHLAQPQTTGYHEEAIMGALGGSQHQLHHEHRSAFGDNVQRMPIGGKRDHYHLHQQPFDSVLDLRIEPATVGDHDDVGEEDLPPLPPPPPPLPPSSATHRLHDGVAGNEPEETEDSVEEQEVEEEEESQTSDHYRGHGGCAKRKSEPTLTQSPVISSAGWSMRTVKRIPLNSGDLDEVPLTEQVSLIAQLQQLERVQSLHQKQVSLSTSSATTASGGGGGGGKSNRQANVSPGEGLHEFFSLPLSVQLSALLTRSLQGCDNGRGGEVGPIEDYLNTLNNTNVAASEHRRGFNSKNWSTSSGGSGHQAQQQSLKDQQQAGPWSGNSNNSNKKQQMKLQNLQGLITRLQKLHSQTVLQQQLEELNGVEMEDGDLGASNRGSRHSTLNRASGGGQSRSVSRANQTADDLYAQGNANRASNGGGGASNWTRADGARRSTRDGPRYNMSGSKNDSVYSMSDSEDGAFVSRMLTSFQLKTDQREPHDPKATRQVAQGEPPVECRQNSTTGAVEAKNAEPSEAGSSTATSTGAANSCVDQAKDDGPGKDVNGEEELEH